ncbi:unnamed protein product [Lactuca virosa]|uniref:Uncharacterized protein n=1 Tax=Lactuca virosa TaxID=75947 RepID=A0AAU9PW01_9ASTR|nr:unnamed protein product [Lactuca virosa]
MPTMAEDLFGILDILRLQLISVPDIRSILLCTAHQVLEQWAKSGGISYNDYVELCAKKEDVSELGKEAKLDMFELPAKIKLLPDPWTPESGLVIAALKLKREQLKAKFKDDLQKLYE